MLPVTALTALALATLLLALTVHVIVGRRSAGIVHGDGDDRAFAKRVRGHANAAEQVPIALIVMALAEVREAHAWALAIPALLLVGGRLSHALYFARHGLSFRLRVFGMLATLLAQAGLILTLAATLV